MASLGDYPQEVAAYTQGRGSLQLSPDGYDECHNAEEVIAQRAYDPEADTANTPDSVFCAHGSGVIVKWDHVFEQMHLESALKADRPGLIVGNLQPDDRALEAILRREFGEQTTTLYRPKERLDPQEKLVIRPPRKTTWIVDGYNMIFCWPELADTAKSDLSAARRHLLNDLSSFCGFREMYADRCIRRLQGSGKSRRKGTVPQHFRGVHPRKPDGGCLYRKPGGGNREKRSGQGGDLRWSYPAFVPPVRGPAGVRTGDGGGGPAGQKRKCENFMGGNRP